MSASIAAINDASRQLFICGGFFLSIVGIFGSCANIFLLTRSRYRRAPCSIFMITGATFDLILLLVALLIQRTVNQIVQFDYMAPNVFVCKTRLFLINFCLPIPIWCTCLSSLNRYCITSRDATHRQWFTAKRSRILVASLVFFLILWRLPDIYYLNPTLVNSRFACLYAASSSIYTSIQIYFTIPVLLTTAPLISLAILTLRTRANLRSFTAQRQGARLERQITSMVLLQALSAACIIPYAFNVFYTTITKGDVRDAYRAAVENLITQIVTLGFYIYYSSAFYIYLAASSEFRRSAQSGWLTSRGRAPTLNQVGPSNLRANYIESAFTIH